MGTETTGWQVPGSGGKPIYGNTHRSRGGKDAFGSVVCCHGFKGYKDYGFFPTLCDAFAANHLTAYRFNFSHSGVTHQYARFEHPELFEKDRWGRQIEDLNTVCRLVADQSPLPIILFGHSRGGVTSMLYTGGTLRPPVSGLITAAAPDYACNLDDLAKDQLRAEGRLLSPSGRTGQDLYVGLDWLKEIEQDPDSYDPSRAAASVHCPMLILHGDHDPTVPVDCAHRLHRAATPNSQIEILGGADHVFNCPNPVPNDLPYEQLPVQTRRMIEASIGFAAACCAKARG